MQHGLRSNRLAHYSDEVVGIKWLGEMVGEPMQEDLESMFRRVESRHGNHRNEMASVACSADQLVAAEDRHAYMRFAIRFPLLCPMTDSRRSPHDLWTR